MDDKKIARINELSAAARERELTEDEQSERAQLRAEYVAAYKKSLVNHLNNVKIVDDKGNKTPLRKKAKKNEEISFYVRSWHGHYCPAWHYFKTA